MYSPTDRDAEGNARSVRGAVLKARLASIFSWVAAAAGLAFVVAFLLQAGLFAYLVPAEKVTPPVVENPDQTTSRDSTISGVGKDNQPYEVHARRSWQDKDKTDLIHLEDVTARFHKPEGKVYDVVSKMAHYDSKLKEIDLAGKVIISEAGRFSARMEKAHVDVRAKKLTSDVAVEVTSGTSIIVANGLQITDDGANILFLNGVKAHFGAAPEKGDTSP